MEKQKGQKKGIAAIAEWAVIAVLAVTCVILGLQIISNQKTLPVADIVEDTKVVLYEGPKSLQDATADDLKSSPENARDFTLKHCVDTKVEVNGKECYVYDTNVNNSRTWSANYLPKISRTPITYFDFDGTVEIKVTVPEIDIKTVKISPLTYGIEPVIDTANHTVTFTVTTPDAYTLTFNDIVTRAVHIFANPVEESVPDFKDENVIYVGPGEWNIDTIVLKSGQTLYVSGGAVIHGIVNASYEKDITVCGRGIIDGSYIPGWQGTSAYIPMKFDKCENVSISGVMLLNPNAWVVQGYETKNLNIDNIKVISCRPNGDGISIQSCQNVNVANSFVRSWDDSLVVKNYAGNSEDIHFKHMQLWTDLAQSMEIGYETNKGKTSDAQISNVSFDDITVLNNFHKPVISVHNADDALVTDITFNNIVVENAQMGSGDGQEMPYLIDLHIAQSSNWSSTKERGQIRNITINGVSVLGGNFCRSRIKGYDEMHTIENVKIMNLTVLGETVKDATSGKFDIDEKTTSDIVIE